MAWSVAWVSAAAAAWPGPSLAQESLFAQAQTQFQDLPAVAVLDQLLVTRALGLQLQRAAQVLAQGGIARLGPVLDDAGQPLLPGSTLQLLLDGQPLEPLSRCADDPGQLYRVSPQHPAGRLQGRLIDSAGRALLSVDQPWAGGPLAQAVASPAATRPRLVNDIGGPAIKSERLLAAAPQAGLLLSQSDDQLVVRDTASLRLVRQIARPEDNLMDLMGGAAADWIDGRWPLLVAAARRGKSLALVDPATGLELAHAVQEARSSGVATQPGGGCVASRTPFSSEVQLWSADLGRAVLLEYPYLGRTKPLVSSASSSQAAGMAWSPDGRSLAVLYRDFTAKQSVLIVWDVGTLRVQLYAGLGEQTVADLAWAGPSGPLLLATEQGLRVVQPVAPARAVSTAAPTLATWPLLGAEQRRPVQRLSRTTEGRLLLQFDNQTARVVELPLTTDGRLETARLGGLMQGVDQVLALPGGGPVVNAGVGARTAPEAVVMTLAGRLVRRPLPGVAGRAATAAPGSAADQRAEKAAANYATLYRATVPWPRGGEPRIAALRFAMESGGKPSVWLDTWHGSTGQPRTLRLAQTVDTERDVYLLPEPSGGLIASTGHGGFHWLDTKGLAQWVPLPGLDVLQLSTGAGTGVLVTTATSGGFAAIRKLEQDALIGAWPAQRAATLLAKHRVTLWHVAGPQTRPQVLGPLTALPASLSGPDVQGRLALAYLDGRLERRNAGGSVIGPDLNRDAVWADSISTSVALSPSGRHLLVGGLDSVWMLRLADGRLLATVPDPTGGRRTDQFWSLHGERFILRYRDGRALEHDADALSAALDSAPALALAAQARALALSDGGRALLVLEGPRRARWWSVAGAGPPDQEGTPVAAPVVPAGAALTLPQVTEAAAVSPDGLRQVFWGPAGASLHEGSGGALAQSQRQWRWAEADGPDRQWVWVDFEAGLLVRLHSDGRLSRFALADGRALPPLRVADPTAHGWVTAAGADFRHGVLALGAYKRLARLVDWRRGEVLAEVPLAETPRHIAVARTLTLSQASSAGLTALAGGGAGLGTGVGADRWQLITQGWAGGGQRWEVSGGQARWLGRLTSLQLSQDRVDLLQISADGRRLHAGNVLLRGISLIQHSLATIDLDTDQLQVQAASPLLRRADESSLLDLRVDRLRPSEDGLRGVLSPDGRYAAVRQADGRLQVMPLSAWAPVAESAQVPARLSEFSPGQWLGLDGGGALRLVDKQGAFGITLARLDARHWAAVDDSGRFDGSDLENLEGLHWVTPDAPFETLPIEVFMRDFYEPQLLRRRLLRESLPPVPALGGLERLQPAVALEPVRPAADGASAQVRLRVSQLLAGPRSSGAQDLRLFRNGQLVAQWPLGDLQPGETRQVVADGIALPRLSTVPVRFSAYAFNRDRIKSATVTYTLPARPAAAGKPRAWVLSIGINQHAHPGWNLVYAVNDARALNHALVQALRAGNRYREVVAEVLAPEDGAPLTRAALVGALHRWAARTGGQAPTPDDLVVITYAGHGVRTEDGQFHLVPGDIALGPTQTALPGFAQQALSADALALLLQPVDAAELLLVVDACQSAAAVEAPGFKPGPLGNRGLGQLAFDKGMRILAGSQSSGFAIESQRLRHGALTYALAREGIEQGHADRDPVDGRIHLHELLGYSVDRVPALVAELAADRVRGARPVGTAAAATRVQQPVLYDFSRQENPLPLVERVSPRAAAP
jgi:hypothetical protein